MEPDFTYRWELLILVAFGLGLLLQLSYYFFTAMRVSLYKLKPHPVNYPPVSVVICARNEEENLKSFLPLLLQQEYPDFEVVVVNDCSWDESEKVLEGLQKEYRNLVIREIKEVEGREHGKKFALTIGIKAARYETLLLTDADCKPTSSDWITHMMNGYGEPHEIVLGYGKYSRKPGFLNRMIRFDTFFIGVHFLARAMAGNTYMGVGRNLSYKKSLFFKVRGFASHIHIWSGDDDLFVQEVATDKNVSVVIDKGAFTESEPKNSWKSWFLQKKRHHSTARYYKGSHQSMLVVYPISWYLMHFSFIAGIILQYNVLILIAGWLLRTLVQITILHTAARKLDEKELGWMSPLLEIIQRIFVNPIYFFSTLFVRQRRWI